ncbi:MAG: Xaa-Pro dipeptidyl-peptidase [Actinomycetota bacterium]|nr:Xaa-Pro dipeptidyl-peptidase [Actinomycetota bacterium]
MTRVIQSAPATRRRLSILRVVIGAVVALSLAATSLSFPAAQAETSSAFTAGTPTFVDGRAQPTFAGEEVIREDLWVEAPVDSDFDGVNDLVHVEVARPASTETDGVKIPAIYAPSPYYAGGNPITNHDVDVELYVPNKPGRDNKGGRDPGQPTRDEEDTNRLTDGAGPQIGPGRYENYFVPRGFAYVYAESLGSGESTGCPTSGGRNETIGAKAVVDWLNGRAPARDADGNLVEADWTTGKVGMMGVSYNGTLPNAVASTGVEGLETIVPVAAISSWYDYYRANGAVVAPGTYQGEDADVLADYVLTRENPEVCHDVIDEIEREQDRITGDYSDFWAERDYMRDVDKVEASVLVTHGLNDWNVKTKHAGQWYEALAERDIPRKIVLHQRGHTDGRLPVGEARWFDLLNQWFSRWLYEVDNGIEDGPKALIQREDQSLVEYADWPDPSASSTALSLGASQDNGIGSLGLDSERRAEPVTETIVDDASFDAAELAALAQSPHRLVYQSGELAEPLRMSGTTELSLRLAFGEPAANVSAGLIDYRPDGSVFLITEGWTDPQNRKSLSATHAIEPGAPYRIDFDMQPDDYVFGAGSRVGVVLLSSDYEYTLRPDPGTELYLDTSKSKVLLPIVGGDEAFSDALGG